MGNTNYDAVKKPSHYTDGRKYEPKDVIRDWGLNFNLGSAVKYLSRAGRKDDIVQDLSKAKEFIQFEIDAILAEREIGSRISSECINLCDTCINHSFAECWENCFVDFTDVEEDEQGNITGCMYYRNKEECRKHPNCKCSVTPIFVDKEDGTGVSFGVMELDVPAGMPPEEIIQMVINKLYGGE